MQVERNVEDSSVLNKWLGQKRGREQRVLFTFRTSPFLVIYVLLFVTCFRIIFCIILLVMQCVYDSVLNMC